MAYGPLVDYSYQHRGKEGWRGVEDYGLHTFIHCHLYNNWTGTLVKKGVFTNSDIKNHAQ